MSIKSTHDRLYEKVFSVFPFIKSRSPRRQKTDNCEIVRTRNREDEYKIQTQRSFINKMKKAKQAALMHLKTKDQSCSQNPEKRLIKALHKSNDDDRSKSHQVYKKSDAPLFSEIIYKIRSNSKSIREKVNYSHQIEEKALRACQSEFNPDSKKKRRKIQNISKTKGNDDPFFEHNLIESNGSQLMERLLKRKTVAISQPVIVSASPSKTQQNEAHLQNRSNFSKSKMDKQDDEDRITLFPIIKQAPTNCEAYFVNKNFHKSKKLEKYRHRIIGIQEDAKQKTKIKGPQQFDTNFNVEGWQMFESALDYPE